MQLAGLPVDTILPVALRPRTASVAPRVGTPAFRAGVAALLDPVAPARAGCQSTFFARGDDVLRERLALIDSAGPGDHVLLQTFIFKDDVTGAKVVDALIAAKKRGATVQVLVDGLGSVKDPDDIVKGPPAYRRLKAAGVDAALINPPHGPIVALAGRLGARAGVLLDDQALCARLEPVAPSLLGLARRLADPQALADQLAAEPAEALAFAVDLSRAAVDAQHPAVVAALGPVLQAAVLEVLGESADLLRGLGRDHRKQLVVYGADKAAVMMGGNNIGDDYQLERDAADYDAAVHQDLPLWNDAEARIDGRGFTDDAIAAFARTWKESTGGLTPPLPAATTTLNPSNPATAANPARPATTASAAGEALRLVVHRPLDVDAGHETTNLLLQALDGAGRGDRVVIENPYFHPLPELKDAMIRAARRGARLDIVTNGPNPNNDAQLVAKLSRRFVLKDLVAEPNIAVYETRGDADPIHRKTFLVQTADGQDLYVLGSQNLDGLSTRINREVVVVGGSALQDRASVPGPGGPRSVPPRPDAIAQGLARDAAADIDPRVSRRLRPADFVDDNVAVIASEWAHSVLLPVT
jgi:phosphatidylserine/phosphatidylglycerophosphate/cardiolipin synthase-like enzyme